MDVPSEYRGSSQLVLGRCASVLLACDCCGLIATVCVLVDEPAGIMMALHDLRDVTSDARVRLSTLKALLLAASACHAGGDSSISLGYTLKECLTWVQQVCEISERILSAYYVATPLDH